MMHFGTKCKQGHRWPYKAGLRPNHKVSLNDSRHWGNLCLDWERLITGVLCMQHHWLPMTQQLVSHFLSKVFNPYPLRLHFKRAQHSRGHSETRSRAKAVNLVMAKHAPHFILYNDVIRLLVQQGCLQVFSKVMCCWAFTEGVSKLVEYPPYN